MADTVFVSKADEISNIINEISIKRIWNNISNRKESIFINNETDNIDIEALKNKFPALKEIYFAKNISDEIKNKLIDYKIFENYALVREGDENFKNSNFAGRKYFVYYPIVYSSDLTIQKEDKCAFLNATEIDINRAFFATKTCHFASSEVNDFFEKNDFQDIVYGEFSTNIGSTLIKILPSVKKAYVTDFPLYMNIVKKRLENSSKEINMFSLTEANTLENVLNKLKNDNVHFDVVFFDIDHKEKAIEELKILSEITNYLIVHDVNWEQVKEGCEESLKDFEYDEKINKLGTITRIYHCN